MKFVKNYVVYLISTALLAGAMAFAGCGDSSSSDTYTLSSLNGAWLMNATTMNHGYNFFITDGAGQITADNFYSSSTQGSNTYTVQSNGAFTLTMTEISGTQTFSISGTLTSSTAGTLTGAVGTDGVPMALDGTITKVPDLTLCQGAWTGTLSTGYSLAFTIKADGTLDTSATRTITGGTITSGAIVGVGNAISGYFTTSIAVDYNAFRISGTLTTGTPTTISGNFDNDSADSWPVGSVELTK